MPLYVFYPLRADGSALMFEARSLVSDAEAVAHCEVLCPDHASSVGVTVWDGERLVHTYRRPAPAVRPAVNGEGAQA